MSRLALGIDVGGTEIKACLSTDEGVVVREWSGPTRADLGPDATVETVVGFAGRLAGEAEALAERGLVGVGLAVPGEVDEESGIAVYSSNIGWRDAPLRDLVARATALPVSLGHDVRAGAVAEARWGASREHPTSLFIPLGTGLAAAFVQDGRALLGAHGLAGDIGHLQLAPEPGPCGCGRPRCLESVSSARGIARRYSEASGTTATARDVARLVDSDDPIARRVWSEAVDALAVAIVASGTMLDPGVIVIGGGLSEAGDTLLEPLRGALASEPSMARRIVRARFGARSGMIGAAALAWRDAS